LEPVHPHSVRYVKLGAGGGWEDRSIEEARIYWGVESDPIVLGKEEDWAGVLNHYQGLRSAKSSASADCNEMRSFFQADDTCLWITFAGGHLWWCFAKEQVHLAEGLEEPRCYRETIGGWHRCDIKGTPLTMDSLSSRLTQLASYRRTICKVAEADYLVRRINVEAEPAIQRLNDIEHDHVLALLALMQKLHWSDFELLVDLLMARSGWQRISRLGGTMKDIDLLLQQPLTGERLSIQVKSSADQLVLDDCILRFKQSQNADKFLFACHSPKAELTIPDTQDIILLTGEPLARAVLDAGLASWIKDRAL